MQIEAAADPPHKRFKLNGFFPVFFKVSSLQFRGGKNVGASMGQKAINSNLPRLNAVRILTVGFIAFGYASTMPTGPAEIEFLSHVGYEPSWIGIQVLFFLSGYLALKSVRQGRSAYQYLRSRFLRTLPLLACVTLICAGIIYPVLGVSSEDPAALTLRLGRYVLETVSCLNPGQPLPGLLDTAKYTSLIQGAIWTFKWGLAAHIAVALGIKLRLFSQNRLVFVYAVLVSTAYFITKFAQAKLGYSWLDSPTLACRLAFPFSLGMCLFAYEHRLPTRLKTRVWILIALISTAWVWHGFFYWTPAIEFLLTAFWCLSAFWLAASRTPALRFMENWPNITLAFYLVNWPTSQLLLLAMPHIAPWTLIGLSLPLSVIISLTAHAVLTRHTDAFARRLTARDDARTA